MIGALSGLAILVAYDLRRPNQIVAVLVFENTLQFCRHFMRWFEMVTLIFIASFLALRAFFRFGFDIIN